MPAFSVLGGTERRSYGRLQVVNPENAYIPGLASFFLRDYRLHTQYPNYERQIRRIKISADITDRMLEQPGV